MRIADLHLHSCFSDGTYGPEEMVGHAQRCGLAAIALTDHDSVEGCPEAARACEAAGIEFIAGIELTAEQDGDELHILGYHMDTRNVRLLTRIAQCQAVRQNRIREMVARINRLQVPLSADAVFELANCRAPGRPHVARALVAAGLCRNLDEAFERFLKKHRPAWVPKFKMRGEEAIELIHQAGGVAVLAHPGLNRTDAGIPALVQAGLDGIECFHTKHSTATAEIYLELAERFRLLVTGGSDCHGLSKGKPLIGTVKVPYRCVEKLRARAAERRRAAAPHPAP
ncbi:MAG TPA: PHP domain-containing protein [Candidatus Paceibacterota bacterium]|nr:PHP domain-containing protein [Verrucomicrobiota bacterium]HSA08786.1 PHP domain-containing protein [Candidatus Paceibacterota bacterium]